MTGKNGKVDEFPILDSWDAAHILKNWRSSVAKAFEAYMSAVKAAQRQAATDTSGLSDEPALADIQDYDDDDATEDDNDASGLTASDVHGTPALKVALATQVVLTWQKGKEKQLVNPRVLESGFQTQHVPTAKQLFSIETAAQMRTLGHTEVRARLRSNLLC